MLTKAMKWVSITALVTALFWWPSPSHEILLQFVVCMGALLVVVQAPRAGKYFWGAGFLAIAILFNPVVPVALSRNMFLCLDVVCLATFMTALVAVKPKPLLSIPGIINPNRRSYSL
jgi:hypothetical protein